MKSLLSDGRKLSIIRFCFIICILLLALITVWVLILATVIIHNNQPQFISLLLGLFGGGGVVSVVTGFLKVKQKKYEIEKDETTELLEGK